MLIVDDVVKFPFKSILWVFREIYEAAVQQIANEGEEIRTELSQLYLSLEAGEVTEADFDARESQLLDRLDAIEERGPIGGDDEAEDREDDDEEDEDEDEH